MTEQQTATRRTVRLVSATVVGVTATGAAAAIVYASGHDQQTPAATSSTTTSPTDLSSPRTWQEDQGPEQENAEEAYGSSGDISPGGGAAPDATSAAS